MRSVQIRTAKRTDAWFNEIKLTPAERLWLVEVHRLGFAKVDPQSLRIRLRDRLPRGFSYKSLQDKNLLYGEHISLLGIWIVDPSDEYVQATDKVLHSLRDILIAQSENNSIGEPISAETISQRTNVEERIVQVALSFVSELGRFIGGGSGKADEFGLTSVHFSKSDDSVDGLINYENIEHELERFWRRASVHSRKPSYSATSLSLPNLLRDLSDTAKDQAQDSATTGLSFRSSQVWKEIRSEFGFSKPQFGKRIRFVTDKHTRRALFRDIEHAYILCRAGLSKPSVILAGGVIEELLRLYLKAKDISIASDRFEVYVKTCEDSRLLQKGMGRLSDSVRHFRNLVHIQKEIDDGQTISIAMGRSAIASIFAVADDFH